MLCQILLLLSVAVGHTSAAVLGANCNCYCCSSGDACSPVHVGTISLGNPGNISATCDLCTEQACVNGYPDDCIPDVVDPGVNAHGLTIASCDAGNLVDGDPCDNADACSATEVAMVDWQGNLITAQYDLSGLCRSQGYTYKQDSLSSEWFSANICGYSPRQCFPADCANDGVNGRDWQGGPCTPWVATANIGSVVRFFQSNLDAAPDTGSIGSNKSLAPHKQVSCYTDDGQPVQCNEACSVIGTSIIGADGVSVQWTFTNDTNDAGGLIAVGPSTAVSLDPSNPLGAEKKDGPTCQPTSEFDNGIETANIVLKCDPTKKVNEAEILMVDMIGCDYTITFLTGAVCDPICPPGMGKCTSGPNKNFCMAICLTGGLGWFGTLLVVSLVLFSLYCLVGACVNKSNHGMWKIPHEDFWGRCRTCTCCSRYKSDDNGFNAVFGGEQAKFGDVNQHPDEKRRSSGYGSTNTGTNF